MHLVGPWQSIRQGGQGWAATAFGVDDASIPLAAGMNQPRLSWLTSSLLSEVHAHFGDEGLCQLTALLMFFAYVIWARCFYLLTESKIATAIAVSVLFLTTHWHFGPGGPSTFGFFCASLLAWTLLPVVQRGRFRDGASGDNTEPSSELCAPYVWWIVPAIMVAWCNLSGTFLIGIIMLLGVVVGCAIDGAGACGKASSFWKTRRFKQSVYLFEIGVLVTCLHPLGIKIWSSVFAMQQNAFWIAAGGAADINLKSVLGIQLLVATTLTLWIFRSSRVRISGADVFVIAVLLIAAIYNARLFVWTVPMFQLFVMSHLAFRREGRIDHSESIKGDAAETRRPLQFAHSLICLLLIWMAFSFSPLSTPLLGGQPRPTQRMYAKDAPLGVSHYLAENPMAGIVWSPSYWSDWLAWQTGPQARHFTSSNLAEMPTQVQRDYERVFVGNDTWKKTLDRYAVETLVIDKDSQDRLFNVVLRGGEGWRIVFESEKAIVLRRQEV